MKTERDLLREQESNKGKNVKNINSYSVFLYSFALIFFEYLLLDLVITSINIVEYKMNFTLGLLITLLTISIITVLYMSDKTIWFKNAIKNSRLNLLTLIVGTVALSYIANTFLRITLFKLGILPIIIIILLIFIIGKVLEKKLK